jgi:hypothetical protein
MAVLLAAAWPCIAADQPDAEKTTRGTLTIDVLTVDPENKNERQPVANAIVRIEGSEDSRETNERGRARFSAIPTGKVTVQIMVIGADICRLRDIGVTAGEQVVSVVFDKSQKATCSRVQ